MKVNRVHINLVSNTNQVPVYFFLLIHFQSFQVAKHKPVDAVHFVAFLEVFVSLKSLFISWFFAVSVDVFVKVPALILIQNSKHKRIFTIYILSRIWILQSTLIKCKARSYKL